MLFMGFAIGGRWRWMALGALAVGALALLPLFATERFAGLFDLQGGTSFLRVQLSPRRLEHGAGSPLAGRGAGQFPTPIAPAMPCPRAWQD